MSQVERMSKPSFENTLAFLAKSTVAVDRKIHYPPKDPGQSRKAWERMWEVAGRYFGTEETLEEIGERNGLTGERVRQIVKKGIGRLHEVSDADIKLEYPLDSLDLRKPTTLTSRQKRSLAHGGRSIRIAELMREGKSAKEISDEFGSASVANARKVLREWNVNTPYQYKASSSEYKENLERLKTQDLSDQEIQKILDTVTIQIYRTHLKGDNALFTHIKKVTREAGLFVSGREISLLAEVLKGEGIPVGKLEQVLQEKPGRKQQVLRYYFLLSSHVTRAEDALRSAENLDPYRKDPVRELGKHAEQVPSVFQLYFSGSYSHVGTLFAELGYSDGLDFYNQFKLTISDLITGQCPASVFCYNGRYYYNANQRELLKTYLTKRIGEVSREK